MGRRADRPLLQRGVSAARVGGHHPGRCRLCCFEIALGITMVSDGTAVLSIRHVERHWSGFSPFAHRNPYVPTALIVVGLYTRSLPQVISPCQPNEPSVRMKGKKSNHFPSKFILKSRQFSLVEYK
jgi:hypothetical protein